MTVHDRLKELGIVLPPFTPPVANYVCGSRCGKLVFSAGATPRVNGELQYTGHLTDDRIDEGYQAARLCALNQLGIMDVLAGGLDNIAHIIKVTGYINSDPEFTRQSLILNGASDLLVDVFGEAGRHARCAVGVATLGGSAVCEITIEYEVKDENLCRM